MQSKPWQPLQRGDVIDLIAPASALSREDIVAVEHRLRDWGFVPRVDPNVLGNDFLCANTDEQRFFQLKTALLNENSAAVWCLRGGYGSTRLLPALAALPIPTQSKLFMGFSDVTALHIFLNQQWHWETLHTPSARQVGLDLLPEDNRERLRRYLFGELSRESFINLQPLNAAANTHRQCHTRVVGGNLSLVSASLGTAWQLKTAHKTLFLEEVNEQPYRVDRALTQLVQAKLFESVDALIFGEMLTSAVSQEKLTVVLQRFADQQPFPVLKTTSVGHGELNYPLPLNKRLTLELGGECGLFDRDERK